MRTLGRFATVDEAVLCYARWSRGLLLQISARPSCQRAPNTDNAHADACALTFVCVCVWRVFHTLVCLVHAWVGQIVTFFAYTPLAAPWAPPRLPNPGGSPTRLGECAVAIAMIVAGWQWVAPLGRVPWSILVAHCGMDSA